MSGLSAPTITDPTRVKIGANFRCGYDCIIGSRPLMTEFRDGKRELVDAEGGVEIGDNVTLGSGIRIVFALKRGEYTRIGDGCYIWHNSVIGHNCHIKANAVIGVGCNISGMVEVGEWAYIAVGSTVAPRTYIGNCSMIGHGSNVRADAVIPAHEIWVGNPARFLKRNTFRRPEAE